MLLPRNRQPLPDTDQGQRRRLVATPRKHDMQAREVGGGRAPRQPGQVRKEAAATSFRSGSAFGLAPFVGNISGGRRGGCSRPACPACSRSILSSKRRLRQRVAACTATRCLNPCTPRLIAYLLASTVRPASTI